MNNIDVKFGGYHKEFAILTPENYEKLPAYMQEKGIKKLQIKDDSYGWNRDYMPSLKSFDFIDELFVFWTGIDDISEIQCLHNLKKLYLDNGDKTKIDFSNFSFLEVLLSWDRKNIETAWDIPSLKELKLYGLKKKQYKEGESLKSLLSLDLRSTAVEDLSFLAQCKNLRKLCLYYMKQLKDISFLKNLEQLEYLSIEGNKIENFSVVSFLGNLKKCSLDSRIATADSNDFIHLKKLESFGLFGNNQMLKVSKEVRELLKIDKN